MKNPGDGFGGPEYQPPPPYSPYSSEFHNPPYSPFYSPLPTSPPPLSTPAAPYGPDARVPMVTSAREFAVPIATNGQTVTVVSYDPPPRPGCRCVHGILLALFIIAAVVVFSKFLEESTQKHDFKPDSTWDPDAETFPIHRHEHNM